jgi:hypothetical protein
MGDLLSSASLLLTIITVLYALWNPNIKTAMELEIPDYKAQAVKPITDVSSAIRTRAVPLALAACTVALVFAKNATELICDSFRSYSSLGVARTLGSYDAVGTAFVVVVILSFAIAVQLILDSKALFEKRKKLRGVTKE